MKEWQNAGGKFKQQFSCRYEEEAQSRWQLTVFNQVWLDNLLFQQQASHILSNECLFLLTMWRKARVWQAGHRRLLLLLQIQIFTERWIQKIIAGQNLNQVCNLLQTRRFHLADFPAFFVVHEKISIYIGKGNSIKQFFLQKRSLTCVVVVVAVVWRQKKANMKSP